MEQTQYTIWEVMKGIVQADALGLSTRPYVRLLMSTPEYEIDGFDMFRDHKGYK